MSGEQETGAWSEHALPPKTLPFAHFIRHVADMDEGHGFRVGHVAQVIADLAGIDSLDRSVLKTAGELHDTGKLLIPEAILQAPRRLTDDEKRTVQRHPLLGLAVTQWYDHVFTQDVLDTILMHHEHWDGSGYPLGLKGENIPLLVRIVSLADTIDACASRRRYKAPWSVPRLQDYLRKESGRSFDPHLATLCADNLPQIVSSMHDIQPTTPTSQTS
ncbi:HD domain-containing protein [Acetobacter suratthaniensis]|uniref:HD domain-containing protein n=1 Tax=Acetobacter suratthaniensis TaxID=1502841 RepID=A0ABS3LM60_9PROT|nr:HD domain-containing phosphohydrolase [Acetobacter suratthaniensis]MBO1328456.1 HD domain-containing protein [Acetobacter suratthaniensis]MCX2566585.1 HD domain-containing protein [Acetobacter suratthaniensis]